MNKKSFIAFVRVPIIPKRAFFKKADDLIVNLSKGVLSLLTSTLKLAPHLKVSTKQ